MASASVPARLRTMHLVEEIAVALYRGPRRAIARDGRLLSAFGRFEAGERRHRALFAGLLAERGLSPSPLAPLLAGLVGLGALLIALLFGPKLLLSFEMLIERIAIRHYGTILAEDLPEELLRLVREVEADERVHLEEMGALRASL
jgi:3-demethoxyubiquinol 3-hydroxylase